jgi:hypothetical protein
MTDTYGENLWGSTVYLERRYKMFWACHDVPPKLRPVLGFKRFAKSLETAD